MIPGHLSRSHLLLNGEAVDGDGDVRLPGQFRRVLVKLLELERGEPVRALSGSGTGAVEVDRQQDDETVRQQCAVEEERRGRDHVSDDDVEPSRPQPLRRGAGVGDPEALLLQTFVNIPRGHVSADDEMPDIVHVDEGTTAGALGQ